MGSIDHCPYDQNFRVFASSSPSPSPLLPPASGMWYDHKNCYTGQGGDNIDDDSNVRYTGSMGACSQYCDSTSECRCATFEPTSGKCWRLRWCNIDQCPFDWNFRVYKT